MAAGLADMPRTVCVPPPRADRSDLDPWIGGYDKRWSNFGLRLTAEDLDERSEALRHLAADAEAYYRTELVMCERLDSRPVIGEAHSAAVPWCHRPPHSQVHAPHWALGDRSDGRVGTEPPFNDAPGIGLDQTIAELQPLHGTCRHSLPER